MVLLGVFPRPIGDVARLSVQQSVAVANGSLVATAVTIPAVTSQAGAP
jgi:hypothetical protein